MISFGENASDFNLFYIDLDSETMSLIEKRAVMPVISPDLKNIVFLSAETEWEHKIYNLELNKSIKLQKAPWSNSFWSPDGEKLILTGNSSEFQIYDTEGRLLKEVKTRTVEPWASTRFEWSTDGKSILGTVSNRQSLKQEIRVIQLFD